MQGKEQIEAVIGSLKIILNSMEKQRGKDEDIASVQAAACEINRVLYYSERTRFQKDYDFSKEQDYFAYVDEMKGLIALWETSLRRRRGASVDIVFWEIYEYFKYVDVNAIYKAVVWHFMSLPESLRVEFLSLPKRYTFLKNKIDFTTGDFSLIAEHVEMMANHVEEYRWLYEHLADYRSKAVLNGIIRYWLDFNINRLHALCETVFSDYYDLDILKPGEDEVLVDLGAYTGDSVLDYINAYGVYKKIYAYEITPSTYQILSQNLSGYQNVVFKQKGIGDRAGKMYLNEDTCHAGNHLSDQGKVEVDVTTLDEDIKEPVTIIKMDIEGAEKEAILGARTHILSDKPKLLVSSARTHILSDKPKLLVSSYHLAADIFDIPVQIHGIRDDYKFYMRFNGAGCLWPCDYVLFAI